MGCSQRWAAPLLSKQGVSADYLIPPPPPSVIEGRTRLTSTFYLQEFKPMSPTRGTGYACDKELWILLWATCTLPVMYDNTASPLAISFANLDA